MRGSGIRKRNCQKWKDSKDQESSDTEAIQEFRRHLERHSQPRKKDVPKMILALAKAYEFLVMGEENASQDRVQMEEV